MEKQLIISVGREYGSGGHEIAEKLAKHYTSNCLTTIFLMRLPPKRM